MSIPIVFIHTGDSYYLDFSLNQAHLANPANPVYLITDTITNKYDFVKYVPIKTLFNQAGKFEKVYKHMSTNAYSAELFCFQRWFILKEFCDKYSLADFLYLDSDVMLYCKVDDVFKKFSSYQFTITNKQGPQYCYFSSVAYLTQFCDFILKMYIDPSCKSRFKEKHAYHLKNQLDGGVCDMTAFLEYQKDHQNAAKDLAEIENDEVFDDNMNIPDGFKMDGNLKKIQFRNNFPYGILLSGNKEIKFNALHFQGPAKKSMYRFYKGNNLNALKTKIARDLFLLKHYFFYRILRRLGYIVLQY